MSDLRALGREIEKGLGNRSQSWLARESGIGQSTISRLIRGKARPNPDTLEALASALGVDSLYFMKLAGLPVATNRLDPTIVYVAQRLNTLPSHLREGAVSVLLAQIDAFHEVWKREKNLLEELEKEKAKGLNWPRLD